ncbi:hypothetical protein [Bifidobacterium bombi]|uniref:DUF4190 domain-containing protein n=1 Tax=Bifidobacterium bombi DSM 19703 TaxID=1341695 RepID=A0A080N5M7_9BIFI|nr:hypothetical protein [Bifidobacterium bombi]KFF30809.1 hypothetical protein BBOMB_0121 [Bifidobacterium bombi DSM 19703]
MSDSETKGMASQQQPQQPGGLGVAQPQYGQFKVPEYGALASQFPPDYNPYVFGEPEPDTKNDKGTGKEKSLTAANGQSEGAFHGQRQNGFPPFAGGFPSPGRNANNRGPYNQSPQSGGQRPQNSGDGGTGYGDRYPVQPGSSGRFGAPMGNGSVNPNNDGQSHEPDMVNGVDMNDPQQNPLWGRWSALAVTSFVLSLWSFEFPLLLLVMGLLAMRRTKVFHMRGHGLAIATVMISILAFIVQLWFLFHPQALQGILDSLYTMLLGSLGAGNVGGNPLSA